MEDPRRRYPIDDALIGRLDLVDGDALVELGCGAGFTLAAAAERAPGATLLGLDLDAEALDGARELLAGSAVVARADLATGLPVASGSVTKVLCHNVLEHLPDPTALLEEAHRALRPGGRSVWSHTDFESVIISGGDPELTRRVVAAYAASPDDGQRASDGRLGRRLAGLVRSSPLEAVGVDAHVLLSTELRGPAEVRVRSTFALVRDAARAGVVDLTLEDVEAWLAGLCQADGRGEFLYAHTTFVVVADRRA